VTSRRRWMGPKHGIARGVAVFGTSGSRRIETIDGPLPDSGRLKSWSLSHSVVLADDSEGLEDLDEHLDEWSADPTHHEQVDLGNEVGIYLGNVIVNSVKGAQWNLWPNGHPVISLASAREMDVIALVGDRLLNSVSSLSSIYTSALAT
jgi:hypothetical protein